MKKKDQKKHNKKKKNLAKQLKNDIHINGDKIFKADKIHYEISDRVANNFYFFHITELYNVLQVKACTLSNFEESEPE